MVHNGNWSIIIRSQRTAKTLQCCSAFCLPRMFGTWLPLPEVAPINMTAKLTSGGGFHKFLYSILQVEGDYSVC